jgi:hypothetical protein
MPDPDDRPVLPDTTSDERAVGWGDEDDEPGGSSDEWLRAQRPPHHDQD